MIDHKRESVTVCFRFKEGMVKKGENLQCDFLGNERLYLLGDAKTLSLYLPYPAPPAEIIGLL